MDNTGGTLCGIHSLIAHHVTTPKATVIIDTIRSPFRLWAPDTTDTTMAAHTGRNGVGRFLAVACPRTVYVAASETIVTMANSFLEKSMLNTRKTSKTINFK